MVEGGLKVNGRTAIGESLRREFGFGDIATGTPTAPDVGAMAPWNTATPGSFYSTGEYASQGPQESIPLRTLQTGDVPQTGQQTRPSFLRSFLMNLPTATAGSFQPGGQGGVGGAFRSLQARDRFNEQMGLEQQDRQLRLGQMQRQGVMDESTIRYRNAQIENMNRPPKVSLQHVELASPDDPTQGVPGTFEPASGKYRDAAGNIVQSPRFPQRIAPKNTAEQIKSQINDELSKPNPNQGVVKSLQDRLRALDPLGTARVNVTVGQKGEDDKAVEIAAQALASGDLTRLRDISSFRGAQRLLIYARAKELNPQFNTAQVDRKVKMLELYTTGKQGDQLQSFGTFLEHAGALADTFASLKGVTSARALNTPINKMRLHILGDKEYQKVLTALDPVQKEFEGYLLNNRALYVQDRVTVEKIINGDLSPAQIMGALEQMGHTVQARYNEANSRFRNTVGGSIEDVVGPLPQEAVDAAKKIGIRIGGNASGGGTTQGSGGGGRAVEDLLRRYARPN